MEQLPDLEQLASKEKDDLIRHLFAAVQTLTVQVQVLTARVRELEGQLSKNSGNSSKPPSSDGLKKTSSLRAPGGNKPGGQPGHQGKTLRPAEVPDAIARLELPAQCDACARPLEGGAAEVFQRRQVFDIPVVKYQVTEYQALRLRCRCGKLHQSEFAPEIGEAVQYGPNVQALAVHLIQGQLLPFARAGQLLRDLYRLDVSPATLCAWVDEAARRVEPSVEAIAQSIQAEAVVHADESGLRVAGKLQWLHTAVTSARTWYGVHPKRGMEAITELGVLPGCAGRLVHDCLAAYWQLKQEHSLCCAHLLRELTFECQIGGQTGGQTGGQPWAQEMILTLGNALQTCDRARAAGAKTLPEAEIATLTARYRACVQAGQALNPPAAKTERRRGRAKQSSGFNLLKRLQDHEREVLCFLHDLAVPFTNNLAERAIRMPKVKQRISGCFRTFRGAQNFCNIRSYLDSARKQGFGMLLALQAAFSGQPLILA